MKASKSFRVTNKRLIELAWRMKLPTTYQMGTPSDGLEDSLTKFGTHSLFPVIPIDISSDTQCCHQGANRFDLVHVLKI